MKYITHPELYKLSAMCRARKAEMERTLELAPDCEGTQAGAIIHHEIAYMEHLIEKLEGIAESGARRIEITI